jgi:hypothetical protein
MRRPVLTPAPQRARAPSRTTRVVSLTEPPRPWRQQTVAPPDEDEDMHDEPDEAMPEASDKTALNTGGASASSSRPATGVQHSVTTKTTPATGIQHSVTTGSASSSGAQQSAASAIACPSTSVDFRLKWTPKEIAADAEERALQRARIAKRTTTPAPSKPRCVPKGDEATQPAADTTAASEQADDDSLHALAELVDRPDADDDEEDVVRA